MVRGRTLSVKVNDVVGRNFGSFKGVREDDPPGSPFLFNIADNCLQRMVQKARGNRQLTGLIPHLIQMGWLSYNMLMVPFYLCKIVWRMSGI